MAEVAAARSAALNKNLFIYIAIEIFIRYLSQKSSFSFMINGDQRWNRWERGRKGDKALLTFLPLKSCG